MALQTHDCVDYTDCIDSINANFAPKYLYRDKQKFANKTTLYMYGVKLHN